MEMNLELIKKNIGVNNEKLIPTKKSFEHVRKDVYGNEYTVNYYTEEWHITKTQGRNSVFYKLEKPVKSLNGKTFKLTLNLTDEQVEYINYVREDILKNLSVNSVRKENIKTRFVFGLNEETGKPYVRYQIVIADRIVISNFISPLHVDMLMMGYSNLNTCWNVIIDSKKDIEDINSNEVDTL